MKIRKGDTVVITAGKDRGKKGKVLKTFPGERKLIVEKINHTTIYLRKSQQNPKGGIAKIEGKIDVSNVELMCPRTNKPTRVGYTVLADGVKHRVSKKSGEIV